jgi:hypothetical protein
MRRPWSKDPHWRYRNLYLVVYIYYLYLCGRGAPLNPQYAILYLTESFGFGLESESAAGFGVNPKPNPSIDSYSGSDRIQKSNTRTPNPLKKIVLAPRSNQKY